ncbi:MAG: hypothetical protein IKZ97_04990 [Butyrivibrio sp.]|nr:hypothetical protein [Butyrivibrio sp.]
MKNRGVQLLTCLLSAAIFAAAGFVSGTGASVKTETVGYTVEQADASGISTTYNSADALIAALKKAKGDGRGYGYSCVRLNGYSGNVYVVTSKIFTGFEPNENFSDTAFVYAQGTDGKVRRIGEIPACGSSCLVSLQDGALIVAKHHDFTKYTVSSDGSKLIATTYKEEGNEAAFKKACKAPEINFTLAR